MFRRSLILFGAIVLLGLLLTYGYALFGFGGPGGAIAQARLHVAAGDYLRAINDLDLYERSVSLKRDPEKFRELLRLRYVSHDSLGNSPAALRDLERLLAETEGPGEQLRLDHIRLLALTGAGEAALTEARAFLVDHPDHGRALELAGEACQTIYRAELAAVLAQLELDVAARDRAAARSALLAYLYRPEGDTEVEVALATLQQAYSADSRLVASWPPFRQRLAALRTHILEAIGFFQQSLEAGDEPVAAFHGLALSLEQAERFDDLLLLCESYRHRFDHAYVQDAGSLAAWALVQLGLEQNAIATVNRWLPPGQVAEGAVAGRITGTALDLYLARIVAAWRLQDAAALDRIRPDVRTLLDAKLPVYLALTLLTGLSAHLRNQTEPCEAALAPTMRALQRTATPHGQVDLLGIVAPVRAANLRAAGATNAEVATVLTDWIAARPDTIEPLVAYADHQLAAGVASGAMTTARAAQRIAPNDESLLTLRLRIARELYRDTGQDGPGLLLQCKQRATVVPEVPDPICYLLCGEAALTAGVAEIARACGRAAVDAMPRARAGRLLEARGELLAGRPATAAVATDNLLASLPPDRETVELALTAHRAAGKSNSRLHWLALRTLPPNPRLATEVLRDRSDDGAGVTLPLARAQLAQPELPPGLAALTAATFARAGDRATAERLLGRIASDPDTATAGSAELTADLATAVAELLRLGARSGDVADAALSEQALGWLLRFGLPGAAGAPVLIALARDLATERPNTAYALVSTALAAADPEQRDGGGYALAGDLALRLGHDGIAESNWTAALAFPDGRGAAESLARLCFATDRAERALQVYRLATDVADPALALRCGNLAAAERLLAQALERDPGDLLANVVVTVVGQPSPTSDLAIETAAERDLLLELASILRSAGLAKLALPRLRDLAERQPTASAKLLLARGLWLAGEGKAAAALHGELFEQGMATLPFWREVAAAACVPGYEPVVAVAAGLAAAAANGELAKSPFSYAVAVHRLADVVAAAGHGELALAYRAPAWLQFDPELGLPRRWVPTVADADRLAAAGRPLDAWWVLDRLRPTLDRSQRAAAITRMLELAEPLSADTGAAAKDQRATIYEAVRRLAGDEGPYGAIVHFLLRHAGAQPDLAPVAKRQRELLRGHLDLVGAGRDDGELLGSTIAALVADLGLAETLATLERVLADHPTALALWRERAALLQHLRRGAEGVADLRNVLAHVDSAPDQLDLVERAATEFALTEADIQALDGLPAALRDGPRGNFTRGLVALRRGLPDEAVTRFEQAEDAGDAFGLLAHALALLQSPRPDGVELARTLLLRLANDYPTSSAARYAGSFARQLEPR